MAAIALVEGISRLLPGMMGNPQSLLEESHCAAGLLEYPSYTRPQVFRGIAVPEVLTSGNHGAIARWRKDRAIERTAAIRPDLMRALEPSALDKTDREKLGELRWFSSTENPKLRRVRFRQAVPADALELSEFAARTWPDACPPTMSEQAIADYIANNLNSEVFSQYLCNPKENLIYLAELSSADEEYETDWRQNTDETPCAGQIVAYLLVHLPRERDGVAGQEAGAPVNFQYDGQLREGPLVYLSKAYVARTWRGSGVFAAFAKWALAQVRAELAQYRNPFIWLGTQIDNRRAQRAYRRIGFQRSGKREFRVGDEVNIDVTMARPLNMAK